MTQEQVVGQLQLMGIKISKSTYAKLETNRMKIKVSELVALSKIFDADIAKFFYSYFLKAISIMTPFSFFPLLLCCFLFLFF